MYNDKDLKSKMNEVKDFSDILQRFVLTTNQININESLMNVYNKYDSSLRKLFVNLVKCEKLPSSQYKLCINKFKDDYDSLRSQVSQIIEKDLA